MDGVVSLSITEETLTGVKTRNDGEDMWNPTHLSRAFSAAGINSSNTTNTTLTVHGCNSLLASFHSNMGQRRVPGYRLQRTTL